MATTAFRELHNHFQIDLFIIEYPYTATPHMCFSLAPWHSTLHPWSCLFPIYPMHRIFHVVFYVQLHLLNVTCSRLTHSAAGQNFILLEAESYSTLCPHSGPCFLNGGALCGSCVSGLTHTYTINGDLRRRPPGSQGSEVGRKFSILIYTPLHLYLDVIG